MVEIQTVSVTVHKEEPLSTFVENEQVTTEIPVSRLTLPSVGDTTYNSGLVLNHKNPAFSPSALKSFQSVKLTNNCSSHYKANHCEREADLRSLNNSKCLKNPILPKCEDKQCCITTLSSNKNMCIRTRDLPSFEIENINCNNNVNVTTSSNTTVQLGTQEMYPKGSSKNDGTLKLLMASRGLIISIITLFVVFGASISVLIYFAEDLGKTSQIDPPSIPEVTVILNQTQNCGIFPTNIYVSTESPSSLSDSAPNHSSLSSLPRVSSPYNNSSNTSGGRVVGGVDANILQFPWQVALFVKSRGMSCGGAVILKNWILTAAHCTQAYGNQDDWIVYAGTSALSQKKKYPAETRKVSQIIQHLSYRNDHTYDYDISLMKLDHDLTFSDVIQPICVPPPGQTFPDGMTCYVSGWGATDPNAEVGKHPDVLQQAKIEIIQRSTCNRFDWYDGLITTRMICAGKAQGGVDACQGDSGGPLACFVSSRDAWVLAGGVSWGIDCGKPKYPGVYTQISFFTDWIWTSIGKAEGWIPESSSTSS